MTVPSTAPRRAPRRRARRAVALLAAAALSVTAAPLAAADETDPPPAAGHVASGDASVTFDAATTSWSLSTSRVERVVTLRDGRYLQTSLRDRAADRQLQQSALSSEFRVRVDGVDVRGSSGGWELDSHRTITRADGALVLTVDLHRGDLGVRRTYVIYPQTSFVEERTDVTNLGDAPITLNDYSAVSMRVLGDDADAVDLWTMTGDKAATKPYHQLRGPVSMASGLQNPGGRGGNVNAQFLTLRDRETGDGLVVTWDYTGNWVVNVGDSSGKILVEPRATIATPLEPGRTVQGPVGRIGLYHGDLDDLGNTVLDFTYRYLWNHTHDEYFPLIRYGGYGSDVRTVTDKVDQLSYIGGDMVWIDDGWQDALGDWNDREGEPIAEYREYARLHGQKLGLWLVPWGAEAGSDIASQHPEWMVNRADRKGGLDTTLPGVVEHVRETVNARQDEFGPFMLKTDFGADSGNLHKAQATRTILENFVSDNPDASLQLCSDGGGLLNLGTAGLADLVLQQDGAATRSESYWTSLLYPTEKLIHTYGRASVGDYRPSNRSQLGYHFTVAGDTTAGPEALEPVRRDADLYRYLRSQGVLGRWVKVYRPTVSAGDATGVLQKMSGDGERGYLTFPMGAFAAGAVTTVFLKGLDPRREYTISSQEGTVARDTRTGEQWMRDGVLIDGYHDGEVVYLNLEDRPGAGTDDTPPSAPTGATVTAAQHLGFEGVEVTWSASTDDRWLSSYEILKNGDPYWKVSKGEFWFDRSGTLADRYEVRAVDGDDNVSGSTRALLAGEPTEAPARAVVSTTAGWATGLRDGTHDVVVNLWWGTNADTVRLYENGDLVEERLVAPSSPAAQEIRFSLSGRANGTYAYTAELENAHGVTNAAGTTVVVDAAEPGRPVLSHDDHGDGTFTLRADLWWGTNATSYRFLEDGTVLGEGELRATTPAAQSAELLVTGATRGEHRYTVEWTNSAGTTTSSPLRVQVGDDRRG